MRVAIVNDLRLAQAVLTSAVEAIPGASVAWVAADGHEALARCHTDRPDLVLMDMVMPVMDGAVATRAIMKECPCPILVVTSSIEGNLSLVYEALSAGAIDAVQTPTLASDGSVAGVDLLERKARVALESAAARPLTRASRALGVDGSQLARSHAHTRGVPLVALGASTGGPHALSVVLSGLGEASSSCCCAMIQHIDLAYIGGLAQWLASETHRRIRTATDGDILAAGDSLVAATDGHLVMDGGLLRYTPSSPNDIHRPSIDVFFKSIARERGASGVAVLLTGMGHDGAEGLRALRDAGWHTIAQDEATSIVWGMPGSAVALGGACEILPLQSIGPAVARELRSFSMYRHGAG